jgi:hypothetical protein
VGRGRWATARRRARATGPWLAGAVLAIVLLGPVLGPGPVLTLDLVLIDPVPVPRGVWGLGPELPRRVPLWLPVAWLAPLVSGELLGKLAMAASIAVAFVGAYRLTERFLAGAPHRPLLAGGAGVLYAASPFLLTRLAVGHLMITVPMAVLPWVVPHLLRPRRSLPRTFLAALGLGLAGHVGGLLALIVVAVGLAVPVDGDRRAGGVRRALDVLAVTVLAQLPWLVPGLVVGGTAGSTDAAAFATEIDEPGGLLGLVVGHGFWQPAYQVGRAAPVAIIGALVTVLAVLGWFELPTRWRASFAALAAIGLGGALASAVPGGRDVLAWATRLPGVGAVRESQRLAVLALVVIAPCAALGAARLARGAARLAGEDSRPALAGALRGAVSAVVLAAAVGLALPAVWGIDTRLRPVAAPAGWADAQAIVADAPGPVLALPWHQYFDLRPGSGRVRRVLDPAPFLFGGDVLTASDPELDQGARERLDPREATADEIVAAARDGRPVSERLAALGVRWVLVQHAVDWEELRGIGESDPGLRPALRTADLDLWEVSPGLQSAVWRAEARFPIQPVMWVPGREGIDRPYEPGWLQGLTPVDEGPQGTIVLPGDLPLVWYWPALLVLAGDLLALAGTIVAVRAVRAKRAPLTREEIDGASTISGPVPSGHSLLTADP